MILPQGNQDAFKFLLHQLHHNSWAGVVDLPENTLLLVPFKENLLGILLTKMNVTVARNRPPSPDTSKQISDVYALSVKYQREGQLQFDDTLIDGFYDPGRMADILPFREYHTQPVNLETREILLVDSRTDAKLAQIVRRAHDIMNCFTDIESQARVLALFVSNCFGGDFPPDLCTVNS